MLILEPGVASTNGLKESKFFCFFLFTKKKILAFIVPSSNFLDGLIVPGLIELKCMINAWCIERCVGAHVPAGMEVGGLGDLG